MAQRERLVSLLAEQLDFLEDSSRRFDAGRRYEYKRIALTLRVLLYDAPSGRQKSLLRQLGWLDELMFLDTGQWSKPAPPNRQIVLPIGVPFGMVHIVVGRAFEPALGNTPIQSTMRPFSDWWQQPVIKTNRIWTRERFVLGPSNEEGGGHVDPEPSEWWVTLRDQTFKGAGRTQSGLPLPDLVPAVVRQMAYEVSETLKQKDLPPAPSPRT